MMVSSSASSCTAAFPPLVLLVRSRDSPTTQDRASSTALVECDRTAVEYRISMPTSEYMQPVGWKLVGEAATPAIAPSTPYAICVRTTTGSFRSYSRSSLLHCGISDASGAVYHFDEHGLHASLEGWDGCVSVPLLSPGQNDRVIDALTRENGARWNELVKSYHERHAQKGLEYHSTRYNCFSYIVEFLNTGDAGQPVFKSFLPAVPPLPSGTSASMVTMQTALDLISPRTHAAELYLWLLRQALVDPNDEDYGDCSSCRQRRSDVASASELLKRRFLLFQSKDAQTRRGPFM